jgi:hypothetical protein
MNLHGAWNENNVIRLLHVHTIKITVKIALQVFSFEDAMFVVEKCSRATCVSDISNESNIHGFTPQIWILNYNYIFMKMCFQSHSLFKATAEHRMNGLFSERNVNGK